MPILHGPLRAGRRQPRLGFDVQKMPPRSDPSRRALVQTARPSAALIARRRRLGENVRCAIDAPLSLPGARGARVHEDGLLPVAPTACAAPRRPRARRRSPRDRPRPWRGLRAMRVSRSSFLSGNADRSLEGRGSARATTSGRSRCSRATPGRATDARAPRLRAKVLRTLRRPSTTAGRAIWRSANSWRFVPPQDATPKDERWPRTRGERENPAAGLCRRARPDAPVTALRLRGVARRGCGRLAARRAEAA